MPETLATTKLYIFPLFLYLLTRLIYKPGKEDIDNTNNKIKQMQPIVIMLRIFSTLSCAYFQITIDLGSELRKIESKSYSFSMEHTYWKVGFTSNFLVSIKYLRLNM